jgi:hypothetical protein
MKHLRLGDPLACSLSLYLQAIPDLAGFFQGVGGV